MDQNSFIYLYILLNTSLFHLFRQVWNAFFRSLDCFFMSKIINLYHLFNFFQCVQTDFWLLVRYDFLIPHHANFIVCLIQTWQVNDCILLNKTHLKAIPYETCQISKTLMGPLYCYVHNYTILHSSSKLGSCIVFRCLQNH